MSAPTPDPGSLLASVARRYATATSYVDEGEQWSLIDDPSKGARNPEALIEEVERWEATTQRERTDLLIRRALKNDFPGSCSRSPFRTHFRRPDRFRFEFKHNSAPFVATTDSELNRFFAWIENGVPKSWWTLQPEVEERKSIFQPLGAMAGVSSGVSVNIPRLLMPDLASPSILPPPASVLDVRSERMDGVDCLRIEHRPRREEARALWIDRDTSLIRRLWSWTRFTQEFLRRQDEQSRDVIMKSEVTKYFTAEDKRDILEDRPDDFREFTAESVTTYRPAVDVEIDPQSFVVVLPTEGPG